VVKYDLVDVEGGGGAVELTTPKAMELASFVRAVPEGMEENVGTEELVFPEFYRPEAKFIKERLPDIASPCLYVWGTESDVAHIGGYREYIVSKTGTGRFGSGGLEKQRVQEVWIEDVMHPIPLERPKECAKAIMPWIIVELERWRKEESQEKMSRGGKLWVKTIDPVWMEKISKL
jgi:hypothetical protein